MNDNILQREKHFKRTWHSMVLRDQATCPGKEEYDLAWRTWCRNRPACSLADFLRVFQVCWRATHPAGPAAGPADQA